MSIIPFDDRDGFIWMDGKLVPWREAKPMLTHGLLRFLRVRGERCYGGKIFKNREHTERFHVSGELLGFTIPEPGGAAGGRVKEEVLKANKIVDGYLRPVAWRGSEMMAPAQQTKIHVAIAAWEWPSMYKSDIKEKGIRLAMAEYKRPSPENAPVASKAAGFT